MDSKSSCNSHWCYYPGRQRVVPAVKRNEFDNAGNFRANKRGTIKGHVHGSRHSSSIEHHWIKPAYNLALNCRPDCFYLEEWLGHLIFIQGKCIHCPSPSIEWVVLEVSGRSWPVCWRTSECECDFLELSFGLSWFEITHGVESMKV